MIVVALVFSVTALSLLHHDARARVELSTAVASGQPLGKLEAERSQVTVVI